LSDEHPQNETTFIIHAQYPNLRRKDGGRDCKGVQERKQERQQRGWIEKIEIEIWNLSGFGPISEVVARGPTREEEAGKAGEQQCSSAEGWGWWMRRRRKKKKRNKRNKRKKKGTVNRPRTDTIDRKEGSSSSSSSYFHWLKTKIPPLTTSTTSSHPFIKLYN
jgi:hypothetical protein